MKNALLALAFSLAGCHAQSAPENAPPTPAPSARPPVAPVEAPAAPPEPARKAVAPEPPPLELVVTRELEAKVTAIGIDKPPHLAALNANEVWIRGANGFRPQPLPAPVRGDATARLSVFFGRDYRPRVIGSRLKEGALRAVTLRFLPEGFKPADAEIGKLAHPEGALIAVLGTDDPEVVCKPGDICIVKRQSGWTIFPAPKDLTRVAADSSAGWGVAGNELLRAGAKGWLSAGPKGAWSGADALLVIGKAAWVIDTARNRIHAFDGSAWKEMESPVEHPRAIWGKKPDALWLVGDGGLAFFDGTSFRRAKEPKGPLFAVIGREEGEVWVGGETGLWRVTPAKGR